MYWKRKNKAARAQIDAALEDASYDIVKVLAKKLGLKPKSRKKIDAIAEIRPLLHDATKAAKIFLTLDSLQQKAVAEAVFHQNKEYDDGRFAAKSGNTPKFKIKLGQYEFEPTLLRLFIYSDEYGEFIPQDLATKIKPFVPQPQGFFLKTTEKLPENIIVEFPDWQKKKNEIIALTVRETENEALQDFWSVLRLVEEKKIAVSDKTFYPSAKSIDEIVAVLRDGDFYEIKEDKPHYPQIGAIKGFAWAMILQASKLIRIAENFGGKFVHDFAEFDNKNSGRKTDRRRRTFSGKFCCKRKRINLAFDPRIDAAVNLFCKKMMINRLPKIL